MNHLFIVPKNDAEAIAIIEILQQKGENILITSQTWGASWQNLETDIFNNIPLFSTVYGVELQGEKPENAINIDHHVYENDNRYNSKTAIEQVAEILNIELSIEQKFIAANDNKYIPGMIKLGGKLGFTEQEIQKYIHIVRAKDRFAQGITEQQEKQSVNAIESLNINGKQKLIIINLPHSKCATVTDRLFGLYENLLILSEDGESNFFGNGELCIDLQSMFNGWSGGELPKNGYWGGYADQNTVKKYVETYLNNTN